MNRNKKFIEKVEYLSNKILILKNKTLKEHPYLKYEDRISFEYINLSSIQLELENFVKEYHDKFESIIQCGELSKKIYKVYLAAICSSFKNSHTDKITKVYKEKYNRDSPDYTILKKAFKSENILPADWNSNERINSHRRYKEVLINETGIPKNLDRKIINFFKIYWRYFKNKTIDEFLGIIKNIEDVNFAIPLKEKKYIANNNSDILRYRNKILNIFKKLEQFSYFINDNRLLFKENNEKIIYEASKEYLDFDPLSILARKNSIKKLYKTLENKITIKKFKKLLQGLPGGKIIKLPNKKRKKIRNYNNRLIYGKHKIENIKYILLPDETFSIKEIFSLKTNKIIKNIRDDKFIYIKESEFMIESGYLQEESKMIYNKKFEKRNIYYGNVPSGCILYVDNKKVKPDKPIRWTVKITHNWDNDDHQFKLFLKIPSLRIFNPEYKHIKIKVTCDVCKNNEIINGVLNEEGYFVEENIKEEINRISDQIVIKIFLNLNKKDILIDTKKINFKSIYLFDRQLQKIIEPNYGNRDKLTSGKLLLFINKNIRISHKLIHKEYDNHLIFRVLSLDYSKVEDSKFKIGSYLWNFKEKKVLYLWNENGKYKCNSVRSIELKVINKNITNLSNVYFTVEIEGRIRKFSYNNIIHKNKLINTQKITEKFKNITDFYGKVYISIFYKHKKYHTVSYTIFPKITSELTQDIYKNGKVVKAKLLAEDVIFDNFSNKEKVIDLGQARLEKSDQNNLVSKTLKKFVTIADLDMQYKIKLKPEVWDLKLYNNKKFINRNEIIINDIKDLEDYKLAIISTKNYNFNFKFGDLYKSLSVCDGIKFINFGKYKNKYKESNEFEISTKFDKSYFYLKWPVECLKKVELESHFLKIIFTFTGPILDKDIEIKSIDRSGNRYSIIKKKNDIIKSFLIEEIDLFNETRECIRYITNVNNKQIKINNLDDYRGKISETFKPSQIFHDSKNIISYLNKNKEQHFKLNKIRNEIKKYIIIGNKLFINR